MQACLHWCPGHFSVFISPLQHELRAPVLVGGKRRWEQEPMGRLAGRGTGVIQSGYVLSRWHLLMELRGGQSRPKATLCGEGRRVVETGMNGEPEMGLAVK